MHEPVSRVNIRKITATGLVAFFLAAEPFMWWNAVEMVTSDKSYIWEEAAATFVVMNIVFVGIPTAIVWDMVRPRA
jgi:hypothetical protein